MANNLGFAQNLHRSDLFAKLKESNEQKEKEGSQSDDSESKATPDNIMCYCDGALFVWDGSSKSLFCRLPQPSVRSVLEEEEPSEHVIQLLLTEPPNFPVTRVLPSPGGQHLALSGPRGLLAVDLPLSWGRLVSRKPRTTCRTVRLATRHLQSTDVVQTEWLPDSPTGTHLLLLTTDNSVSLYCSSEPETPVDTVSISPPNSAIQRAMGESVVAMSISHCVASTSGVNPVASTAGVNPVYVLKGNGEVVMTTLRLDDAPMRRSRAPVVGPLTMRPPAVDNYGLDYCAVVALPCRPEVLLLATTGGRLYHCVVLSDANDSVSTADSDDDEDDEEPVLYVYEAVDLELDDPTQPIRVEPDPVTTCLYHVVHSAGVHSVFLPWALDYQTYCETDPSEQDQPCLVDYILCTRTTPSAPSNPIVGLSVLGDPIAGSSLLILTQDIDCIHVPLADYSYNFDKLNLATSTVADPNTTAVSPLRKIQNVSFLEKIRNILQRKAGNPIVKGRDWGAELGSRRGECLDMVGKVIGVYREEYMEKQNMARLEVEERVGILVKQQDGQTEQLVEYMEAREGLCDRAEQLAERYDQCRDLQDLLEARLTALLNKVSWKVDVVSDDEMKAARSLSDLQENLGRLREALDSLKLKVSGGSVGGGDSGPIQIVMSKPTGLPEVHANNLKELLYNEANEIANMRDRLNSLKVQIGL